MLVIKGKVYDCLYNNASLDVLSRIHISVTRWQLHGLAGFLIPFVDETLQLFTEGRSGQISDVWLDCAGVLFGTVLFLAVGRWHMRRKGKKNVEKKL